ncbi:MAG: hypothetical protein JJU02_08415 [Cryomorphaceae bacterium]|nr:hypothetical protein [Cryomorphaceae bacterium]
MRTIKFSLLAIALGFSCQNLYSQIKLVEGGVNFMNFIHNNSASVNLETLQRELSGSEILMRDQTGFQQRFSSPSYNFGGVFWAGFKVSENKRGPIIRLGVILGDGYYSAGSLYKKESFPFDTLTSSSTGNVAYLDSLHHTSRDISFNSQQIGLNISAIFYWDKNARWSVYSGLGLGAVLNFNSYFLVSEDTHSSLQLRSSYGDGERYNRNFEPIESERLSASTGGVAFVYLPLGLDFRIGTNPDNFWGKSHLFYEINPSVSIHNNSGLGTRYNAGFLFQSGYRLEF